MLKSEMLQNEPMRDMQNEPMRDMQNEPNEPMQNEPNEPMQNEPLSTKRQYNINNQITKKKNKKEKMIEKKKVIREKKRLAVEKINNINEVRTKFYFKLCTEAIYTIDIKAISIIDKFDKIYNTNSFSGTEETPLIIKMNIDDLSLNLLLEYIKVWQDIPNECNYPIQSIIQTRIIEQILKEQDLKIFNKYINEYIINNINTANISHLELIELKIDSLINLLNIFDVDYLYIPSLCNKINAYIATLIWSCSKKEINEYLNKKDME
jgi:hypothetical protein